MARSARLGAWAAAVLLLGTACTLLQHQPWHGPVILSLSSSHGINAGDIPALALFALGLALATGLLRGRDAPAGNRPAIRFATPACAVAVGALLLTGVFDEESPAEPLLPAGGGRSAAPSSTPTESGPIRCTAGLTWPPPTTGRCCASM